jgi:hypothetical protein
VGVGVGVTPRFPGTPRFAPFRGLPGKARIAPHPSPFSPELLQIRGNGEMGTGCEPGKRGANDEALTACQKEAGRKGRALS